MACGTSWHCFVPRVHRASPLDLAGHAVVPDLLGQVGDGLLQAHVEAQPLAEVVPYLQKQGHLAPHAACCPLQIAYPASLAAFCKHTTLDTNHVYEKVTRMSCQLPNNCCRLRRFS